MSLSLLWNVLQMLLYAAFLDTELVSSWCALCKRWFSSRRPRGFLHHSHQANLGVVSAWRHPISLELSNLVVAVQVGFLSWVCWQPVDDLSSSLLHTWSLSLWHHACFSAAPWHSQWDASVWNEDASMMSCCGLVDGRPYWWSTDHTQHTFLGAEDHYCCFAFALWSDHSFSGLVVCAKSGTDVTKKDELVCTECCSNNTVQIIVEFVFDFIWVGHCRRIGTDDGCMFIAR